MPVFERYPPQNMPLRLRPEFIEQLSKLQEKLQQWEINSKEYDGDNEEIKQVEAREEDFD